MRLLESTLSQMTEDTKEVISNGPSIEDTTNITIEEKQEEGGDSNTEAVVTQENSTDTSTENEIREPSTAGQAELISNQNKETSQVIATYYIVKEGDTMLSISKKMYQSEKYVKKILEANEMSEKDKIFPGQKIKIPSLDQKT